jgi:hypothetical protein
MRVVLWSGLVALALSGVTTQVAAQGEARTAVPRSSSPAAGGQSSASAPVSTQPRVHVEVKAAAPARQAEPQRHAAPQRQSEPQRQAGPQRQPEPQRHAEQRRDDRSRDDGRRDDRSGDSGRNAQPRNDSNHWNDPGPAWRPVGPAWSETRRDVTQRPGADRFRAAQDTYSSRGDRKDDRPRRGGKRRDDGGTGYPYFVPFAVSPYPYSYVEGEPAPAPAPSFPADDDEPYGFLRLRVQPRNADVYVDGALSGTVDDFGGTGERMLRAGPHRIEIMAPGFATLTFDVRVPANDTVTFSRELDPLSAASRPLAAAPVEIPHKPVYIVPRCYIGDRPPQPSDVPAGCNIEDVRIIP